jgi:hypothetical protein
MPAAVLEEEARSSIIKRVISPRVRDLCTPLERLMDGLAVVSGSELLDLVPGRARTRQRFPALAVASDRSVPRR